MDYRDIVTRGADGRRCVRHLPIKVEDVLVRLASGVTEATVLAEFPDLTCEDIRACVAFANDHIKSARDITAENPNAEVWKYLRFFLDGPATAQVIRRVHDIPADTQTQNVRKQAQQIGFCIRQAEQYFMASTQVGLPTRPVLLYYGALSLSQALILLKKDGTFSLDARRRASRHNHHGLELRRGLAEDAARVRTPEGFLTKIECSCHSHNNQHWGHFPLFYRSLVPSATMIHAQVSTAGKTSFLERDFPMNCADLLPLDSIAKRDLNASVLFKGLPDLYFSLAEMGIRSSLCRGSVKRQTRYLVSPRPLNAGNGDPMPGLAQNTPSDQVQFQDSFFVDGITPEQKEAFLAFYRRKNPAIKIVDDYGSNLYMSLTAEGRNEVEATAHVGYYPDVAEDLAGRKYYIIEPDDFVPEPAAIFALLFCFSMLCRYYPDVWMKSIDENIRMAELMNVFLNVAYRKFPNLILDQLTLTKHTIHP